MRRRVLVAVILLLLAGSASAFFGSLFAKILSPYDGESLTAGLIIVDWKQGIIPVENWAITVGTTGEGSQDIYNSNIALGFSYSPSTTIAQVPMPVDGGQYTITLWRYLANTWTALDSALVTSVTAQPPEMVSPIAGETLDSYLTTINWNSNETQVSAWAITVGSTGPGSQEYYNTNLHTGEIPPHQSSIEIPMPTNGADVTISLYAKINGTWLVQDSALVTALAAQTPIMNFPIEGATLDDHTINVTWDPRGTVPTYWAVTVGISGPGSQEYYNSNVSQGTFPPLTTNIEVPVPNDGSQVTVSLYAKINGSWLVQDSALVTTVTAQTPTITFPGNDIILFEDKVAIYWDNNGSRVEYWGITAGSQGPQSTDLYISTALLPSLNKAFIHNLPTSSESLHLSLTAKINGVWSFVHSVPVTAAGVIQSCSTVCDSFDPQYIFQNRICSEGEQMCGLPVKPTLLETALQMTDSDGDGYRDDVEHMLYERIPEEPQRHYYLGNITKAYQTILENANNQTMVRTMYDEVAQWTNCYKQMPPMVHPEGMRWNFNMSGELIALSMVLDNRERLDAYNISLDQHPVVPDTTNWDCPEVVQ